MLSDPPVYSGPPAKESSVIVNEARPSLAWHDFIGVALASASVLTLQVTATRLFSFLIWYHFAFLVLSIAFLGFTSGGLAVARVASERPNDTRAILSWCGFGASASTLVCFGALAHLPLAPHVVSDFKALFVFLLAVLVTLAPFVFLGAYLCLAMSVWSHRIGELYAVDLIGSAMGCVIAVVMLNQLGVPAAFLANGLLAFAAGTCTCIPSLRSARARAITGALTMAWLGVITLATHELHPWVYIKTSKPYPKLPREVVTNRASNSLATVETFRFPNAALATLWGLSPTYKRPLPDIVGFAIDGWALTATYKRSEVDVPGGALEYLPAALPYTFHATRNALIIGTGGGLDVLTALHFGAHHVTGVEINSIILDAVKGKYSQFAGDIYSDPRVEIHHAEGRHYLKRDTRKYDLIQLSGVDTYAASQAGAFALHENYLYTVEAMREYLDTLTPDGVLTFTRWLYVPPRQTIRLCAIADRALRTLGVDKPDQHIVVYESNDFSVTLIKRQPFTAAEVSNIQRAIAQKQFELIYAPHVRVNPWQHRWGDNPFYRMWDVGVAQFVAGYPLDISPTTDDRPFFFEYQRWGGSSASENLFQHQNAHVVLLETLLVCGSLCALILWLAWRRHRSIRPRLGAQAHFYFVALGLGYIFVENVLVQRIVLFLGSPAYALTVILFTLLAASGVGSAIASRLAKRLPRPWLLMLGVAVLLVVYAFGLRPILDALLGLKLAPRVLLVVVLIAPLGVLMGTPFPLAMASLTHVDPRLVPWAWVVNGAASVLGSIVTIMTAMTAGFTTVFVCAAVLYVVAALTYERIVPGALQGA